MTDVLYLTHNGITDHIGQSQIAPYNLGLAKRGYRIHIVSAEKPGRDALMERYSRRFAEAGIRWSHVPYHNQPQVAAQLYDVAKMRSLALRIALEEQPRLVHARSWLPLEIGKAVKRETGARFLLDFRHFYIESGVQDSRFPWVYRMLGTRERGYFDAADHVVTLTDRAAQVLDARYPNPAGLSRYTTIPCCADFDHFDLSLLEERRVDEARARLGLAPGQTVLLYLGSIGAVYLLDEMIRLFVELRKLRPDARFLFVCNNGQEEVAAAAAAAGLPADSISLVHAPREDVPVYLALATLSVMFFRPSADLAGCSPTKMAELFAANVPMISNSGVGDLDEILQPGVNASLVVPDFAPTTLRRAVEQVLAVPPDVRRATRARSGEFTLDSGVEAYADIYKRLIGPPVDGARPC
ncbi:glycosyltransferase [Sphingomonas humi]|uniref:Glycosyltransferase subfamily 4-like N-terminal domain-containing protein n=1 Tax=Sphingomonas humi TaxID=335630 RepID=A0ABP7SDW7_9SPHN